MVRRLATSNKRYHVLQNLNDEDIEGANSLVIKPPLFFIETPNIGPLMKTLNTCKTQVIFNEIIKR